MGFPLGVGKRFMVYKFNLPPDPVIIYLHEHLCGQARLAKNFGVRFMRKNSYISIYGYLMYLVRFLNGKIENRLGSS